MNDPTKFVHRIHSNRIRFQTYAEKGLQKHHAEYTMFQHAAARRRCRRRAVIAFVIASSSNNWIPSGGRHGGGWPKM
jgi:hypothetical protein